MGMQLVIFLIDFTAMIFGFLKIGTAKTTIFAQILGSKIR